jgi:hypothetical protein
MLQTAAAAADCAKMHNVAIGHVQKLCNCVLTPNEALKVYSVAKEHPPQWLLNNAKVKSL